MDWRECGAVRFEWIMAILFTPVGLSLACNGLRIDRWRSHKGTRSPQSPTLKWVAGGVWDEESGGRCQSKGSEVPRRQCCDVVNNLLPRNGVHVASATLTTLLDGVYGV